MKNTAYMESSTPPCQIDELVSTLRPIQRHPLGFTGLHLHFSLLEREHKQPYHRRAVATAFNKLIHNKNGQLFWAKNFDLVFICKDCSPSELDTAFFAARRAVEDSPLVKEYIAAGRDDDLCDWYDLKNDMDGFLKMIDGLKNLAEEDTSTAPSLKSMISNLNNKLDSGEGDSTIAKTKNTRPLYDPIEIKNTVAPMGPIQLDQLERNLINMDIYQMMANQTAYVIVGNSKPQPIFVEHYISVAQIKEKLLPTYNMLADKWLFQRLTRTFDKKILQALPDRDMIKDQVISININVETIFTPEFDNFLSKFKLKNTQPLILEMGLFDVISDIQKYYDARDKLTELGCRISLDAVDAQSLAVMDRELLAVDFLKINWKPHYKNLLKGPLKKNLLSAIKAQGNMRIILCHCDTEDALKFGKKAGIHMYQGFLIDKKFGG
ncbi:MAG: EAL domain-containing protein [Emcibacter sp.]|nr:EAL domain-containing protein [Emcibacter sp.]